MNYEGQICRGPRERSSYLLPVAVGCSYNRCKFCTLFRHLKYRELPMEQIEAELERVRSLGGNPKHVFLGDGNAFGLATKRLLEITDLIHRYFPGCQAINMDGTITNIQAKSREELLALRKAGIYHLYLGIESGLDDVLRYMGKDHNLDQAYRQIDRIQRAGFIFDAHIMTGIAGHGRGLENGTATAEFFNRTQPQRIINFSMFLFRSAPLFQEAQAKTFIPATELENLQEERLLLELLKTDGPLAYDGFHDRIEFRVRGTLPDDRKNMLNKLDLAIEGYRNHEPVIAVMDDSSGPLPAQTMTAI